MPTDELVCAFSGLLPDDDLVPQDDEDGRDGIPTGWTRVTIETARSNPRFLLLQSLKASVYEQMLKALPEDQREAARPLAEMQADATYAAFEATIEEYTIEREEVYLSPAEADKEIGKAHLAFREMLGLEEDEGK